MRPRRSVHSTRVFRLAGGTEDNDLWVYDMPDSSGYNVLCSVWVPTLDERRRIAAGENIRLMVWGKGTPPVAMEVTDEPLGRQPTEI